MGLAADRGKRSRPCKACGEPVKWSARYCPGCGAYQDPPADRKARERRMRDRWRVVKGCIVFYLLYLATVLPLAWLPAELEGTGVLVVAVVDAGLVLAYWRVSRVRIGPLLRMAGPVIHTSLLGLGLLVPVLALNLAYHGALVEWFGVEPRSIIEPFRAGGWGPWAVVLAACVMPAIWEEIAFRGLLQGQLSRAVGPREALIMTAVLFAVIHVSVLSGFYLLLVGILLGFLRQRSNSLVPGMVVHFVHNLTVVVVEHCGV